MKIIRLYPFFALFLLSLVFGCQEKSSEQENQDAKIASYQPKLGTLRIQSDVMNSEMNSVKLLNDKLSDSLAAIEPEKGKFTLVVEELPLQEVYFLEISGKSSRKGTSGLVWRERVPVYLEEQTAITLESKPFEHPGSISKAKFFIADASDEQQLLNDWQDALNEQQAEIEGRMEHFSLGMSGATKIEGKEAPEEEGEADITRRFLQKKEPLIASLFLAYRSNEHRKHLEDFQTLYQIVSEQSRETKYGVDLGQRLDRIMNPIEQLDLSGQVVATDERLKDIPWENFERYNYLLLAFWNSGDKASHTAIQEIEEQAGTFEQQQTAIIHISLEDRFSSWQKNNQSMKLENSYKIRNEARQAVIDSLYITALPRYVLVQPDGRVVDADVSMEELPGLLQEKN